jgi:hypothetical protein
MLRLMWRQRKSAFGWVLVDHRALQHDCRARRHLETLSCFDDSIWVGKQGRAISFTFWGTTDTWCLARARASSSLLQHTATIQ